MVAILIMMVIGNWGEMWPEFSDLALKLWKPRKVNRVDQINAGSAVQLYIYILVHGLGLSHENYLN